MWFKNLQIYRLPTPWAIDLAKLDEASKRMEAAANSAEGKAAAGAPSSAGPVVTSTATKSCRFPADGAPSPT